MMRAKRAKSEAVKEGVDMYILCSLQDDCSELGIS